MLGGTRHHRVSAAHSGACCHGCHVGVREAVGPDSLIAARTAAGRRAAPAPGAGERRHGLISGADHSSSRRPRNRRPGSIRTSCSTASPQASAVSSGVSTGLGLVPTRATRRRSPGSCGSAVTTGGARGTEKAASRAWSTPLVRRRDRMRAAGAGQSRQLARALAHHVDEPASFDDRNPLTASTTGRVTITAAPERLVPRSTSSPPTSSDVTLDRPARTEGPAVLSRVRARRRRRG